MLRVDRAAIAVLILFGVFIIYEMAGGSSYKWAENWHTFSYYGSRILWVKIALVVAPPAVYISWVLWHLEHFVPK